MTSIDVITYHDIEILLNLKNMDISKCEETRIIFDWDDTLYPTTWIQSNSHLINDPSSATDENKSYFKQLSDLIINIITNAKRIGEVCIITNAQEVWIEKSCCLMPELIPFLKTIDVISSQDKWKHLTPLPEKWKEYEFSEIAIKFMKSTKSIIKIICVGDSPDEHEATKKAAAAINTTECYAYTKNFVFMKRPTFEELLIQIHKLAECVYYNTDNIITDMNSYLVESK